jgi:predicted transcriptional regulator
MAAGILGPLTSVLRAKRKEAGALQVDVAVRAGVDRSVVTRFEMHQRVPEIGLDRMVDAYAEECGVGWLELWKRALALAQGAQDG